MSLEVWGRYWRDAIVWSLQQTDAGAFAGDVNMRIAPVGFAAGDDLSGNLQLEAGVLTLIDVARGSVLFAAVPIWDPQNVCVPANETEARERDARVDAEATRHGVQLLNLMNPQGRTHTLLVRHVPMTGSQLAADGAIAEYGDGVEGFTPAGMHAVGEFLSAVSQVSRIFFETPAAKEPITVAGAAAPPTVPPVAAAPARKSRGALIAWLSTAGVLALLLVIGTIAGFARGYAHEVVVQSEQEEIQEEQPTGVYDVISTSEQICGDDEDYERCLDEHIGVYNDVCADRLLTVMGDTMCGALDTFIDDAETELQRCGAGCRTVTSGGSWGATYLEAVEVTEMVIVQEYRPEVTRTELCVFDLGPIAFGSCPR